MSDLCSYSARYAPSNSFMTAHLCHSYSEGFPQYFLSPRQFLFKNKLNVVLVIIPLLFGYWSRQNLYWCPYLRCLEGCCRCWFGHSTLSKTIPRICRRWTQRWSPQETYHGSPRRWIHGLSWGRRRRKIQETLLSIHQGIYLSYIFQLSEKSFSNTLFRPVLTPKTWKLCTPSAMLLSVLIQLPSQRKRRKSTRRDGTEPESPTLKGMW